MSINSRYSLTDLRPSEYYPIFDNIRARPAYRKENPVWAIAANPDRRGPCRPIPGHFFPPKKMQHGTIGPAPIRRTG
jgi:hypothetical protein